MCLSIISSSFVWVTTLILDKLCNGTFRFWRQISVHAAVSVMVDRIFVVQKSLELTNINSVFTTNEMSCHVKNAIVLQTKRWFNLHSPSEGRRKFWSISKCPWWRLGWWEFQRQTCKWKTRDRSLCGRRFQTPRQSRQRPMPGRSADNSQPAKGSRYLTLRYPRVGCELWCCVSMGY